MNKNIEKQQCQMEWENSWMKTCTNYFMRSYEIGDIPEEFIKSRTISLPST